MLKQTRLCLGLLVALSLICICSGKKKNELPVENVVKLLTKLERFNARPQLETSGITVPEIQAAYNEYLEWSEEEIEAIGDQQPLVKALIDFLFKPMKQNPAILPLTSNPRDKSLQDRYIQRFENAYKQMRLSYLGKMVDLYYRRAERIDLLINTLLSPGEGKPLTKRMIEEAIAEHDSYKARLEDIQEHEDVYADLEEFKNTNNLLNRDKVRVLRETIFPWKNNALTPENINRLSKMYRVKLTNPNHLGKDGILY